MADRHTSRLADETSPYLRQHAHNPVDWYPWGDEALARAREEDKPIFLSIGYAACHWCHVMERESFENDEIAGILNRDFVCIKVDREERPDLDEIYMTAVMAMTGSGGWPMTVFLAPDLKPFMGGTYFPPEDKWGRIGFGRLAARIAGLWSEEEGRRRLLQNAEALLDIVVERSSGPDSGGREGGELDGRLIEGAVEELRDSFDERWGGFGPPPKFPPSGAVAALLREHILSGRPEPREMALITLDRMCEGGLYDHLGGGFHRYSTDAMWLVPHFEKMLYDNAQLASVYLKAYQVSSDPRYARVAREICEYEMTYMMDPSGGIHSTEDADSEGKEGLFYLWKRDEIAGILGREDFRVFAARFGIEKGGNFSSPEPYHEGFNILHVRTGLKELADASGLTEAGLDERLNTMREKLLTSRDRRTRPGLDDKIITSWNALMISAFAHAYQVLGEGRYLQAADRTACFIRDRMCTPEGRLLRIHNRGRSRIPGYLEDYAFTVQALVDLYEAGFDPAWIVWADKLAGEMIEQFRDREGHGFFNTGGLHKNLIVRTKTAHDGAIPSPQGVAVKSLLRLGRLLDRSEYFELAERTVRAYLEPMRRAPLGHLSLLSSVGWISHPIKEIAVIGNRDSADTQGLLRALHSRFLPHRVIAFRDPGLDKAEELGRMLPVLAGRDLVAGRAAAYVCENYACQKPVTTPEGLIDLLKITSGIIPKGD